MKLTRLVTIMLGCAMALATSATPAAQKQKPVFPAVSLKVRAGGDAALKALGPDLAKVAAWYGKSVSEFSKLARQDRTLKFDKRGRVHFVEEGLVMPASQGVMEALADSGPVYAALPLDQTLRLHSKPGAQRTIYLDFDGEWVADTAWNEGFNKLMIAAPPFDTDGNPWDFSDVELLTIQQVWQRVSEDYAAFDVDVTTELPLVDKLTRTSPADLTFGVRVVVTKDWTDSTSEPCYCAGLSYVASFDDEYEFFKTAWAFYNQLGGGLAKSVAEAVSHEVGHTLGLYHDGYDDGVTVEGYYAGHGDGDTGWAPIMGASYFKEVSQWSRGEYPHANNTEDDLAIILRSGLTLRARDAAIDFASAAVLDTMEIAGRIAISGAGIISSMIDKDVYAFTVGGGDIQITASPADPGGNLDIKLELFSPSGYLLATSLPADQLSATVYFPNALAGKYYLRVYGTGNGNPASGYSNYGSIGQYTLSGAGGADAGPVARITSSALRGNAPMKVIFDGSESFSPHGGKLTYRWDFGDGSVSTSAKATHQYKKPGEYTATLVVTNAAGVAGVSAVVVFVYAPSKVLHASNITGGVVSSTVKGVLKTRASASVQVLDANGVAVPGVTVKVQWSGVASKVTIAKTDQLGRAVVWSPSVADLSGEFNATIVGLSRKGYTYNPSANVMTSQSVSY